MTGSSGTNVADITLVLITNPGRSRKTAVVLGGEATINVKLPE